MKRLALASGLALAAMCSVPVLAAPRAYDEMAWQVFVQMTAPVAGAKEVRFEDWASDSDLYGAGGPKWPAASTAKRLQRSIGATASARPAIMQVASPADCARPKDGAAGNFPKDACIGEEVRHNWPSFHYLASNGLTSVAGLLKAYAGGLKIALPPDSVVAKADWVPLVDIVKWLPAEYKTPDDVRRAYYTNSATLDGKTTDYALVGISIQSKQLPAWLWMTFEQRSNPGRCDIIGCHDAFGAMLAHVAPAPTANSDYGACAKTPALQALFAKAGLAPVWNNYCLKGTQTRYLDASSQPTRLGNSVVERMNHGIPIPQISCITCHAYAGFDKTGHADGAILQTPPLGAPKLPPTDRQDDFVWGVLLAQ
jgi:hypothetical protein